MKPYRAIRWQIKSNCFSTRKFSHLHHFAIIHSFTNDSFYLSVCLSVPLSIIEKLHLQSFQTFTNTPKKFGKFFIANSRRKTTHISKYLSSWVNTALSSFIPARFNFTFNSTQRNVTQLTTRNDRHFLKPINQ